MAQITMSEMLKAGLHFGHQTRRWNPKMKQFILTQRNGIHIINLFKSLDMIDKAYDFIKQTVAHNGTVLFVGTKKQAQEAVQNQATRVNMPYVCERWLGGMLTNFQTVSTRVKRLKELDVPVIVGGCADYTSALHLMRTGAAGILVGFGGGAVSATMNTLGVQAPMATAIADVAEARRDYMDESGGRYVQIIADGGMGNSGNFIKALAMGADAVMLGTPLARATEAPGRGTHWGAEARHLTLPRGMRTNVGTVAPLENILFGPSHEADGTTNFVGALRRTMSSTGYVDVKSFQRCNVAFNPFHQDVR